MRVVGAGLVAAWLAVASASFAEGAAPPPAPAAPPAASAPSRISRAERLHFDLPAVDARENVTLGFWPSMRQSLVIGRDATYLLHGAIYSIPYPSSFSRDFVTVLDDALIGTTDFLMVFVPFGEGWVHEEWHRAVMSRRGIGSYDDIYDFPFFADLINVSHVKDEDLVRLKREHPADQVRMSSAGIEADYARSLDFDKDHFFYGTRAGTLFAQWLGVTNAIFYMKHAAFASDVDTEELNQKEGTNVPIRDFTGLDPDGWVYDLFRPDEPYEARGVHPSGVGIDRYRSESDLTSRERHYLRAQATLSWLNLANPNLFGFYEFKVGQVAGAPFSFNASLGHVMAPFGHSFALNLYAKAGPYRGYGELRAYVSDSLVLPGLSAELVRYELPWAGASVTPSARLWLQPVRQRFFAKHAAPGGSLQARLNVPLARSFEAYLEAEAKSAGWVMGDVFLDESLNVRTGFEAFVF